MTEQQQATCEYLVTYRNPDGSLLLPQHGGCWHEEESTKPYHDGSVVSVCKCGKQSFAYNGVWTKFKRGDAELFNNPNLFTWPGFGELWEAMQAREDFDRFHNYLVGVWYQDIDGESPFSVWLNNPATFLSTVESYLQGLER